ncbi:helix-turn-helix domain-containing protein [Spongiactinospora sp. 9N601]|uniref:helix-turn-helix domain-containing protein n=1 Tax=Spongiactinospora sp. 9N601 TaxID=3375149 RepID=UPI003791830F
MPPAHMETRGRRQRLAGELRRLREMSGLSGRQLAAQIGISQSRVSRIESMAVLPTVPEVTAWGRAVDAPADAQAALRELTTAAFTEAHAWRTRHPDFGQLQDEVTEREANARTICNFQLAAVPALLQTAEYTRHLLPLCGLPYSADEVAAAVAARLERQMILYTGKRLEFLIGESALRWRHGPAQILLVQLDRIASISTLENVSIGLIPHRHPVPVFAPHGFALYQGNDEHDSVVLVETTHAEVYVTDPGDIRLYHDRWQRLCQAALSGDQARSLLTEISREISREINAQSHAEPG